MHLGLLNSILYCVQFSRELDERDVERITRMILEQPFHDLTTEEEYARIEAVLAEDSWDTDLSWQPHDEPSVRGFLRRVLDRLDALRPWQEPPYRTLGLERWEEFGRGTLLAHVRLQSPARDPMHARLRAVPGEEHELRALVLRLRSGDEVALVAPPLPNGYRAVLMGVRPHRSRAKMIEAFLTHTGYPRDRVSPVVRRWWAGRSGETLPPGLRSLRG
ncbi:hypothetical protein ACFS5L_20780 [Streptomyces phyllanthi]|uniref:Uncharacterized protein n=1 Tax=Streptomyces phyllanthi TaxID=1803180 RepID=A0A5N8WGT9_9ACTN|nr:hypothetical protein [Streptomyces phyllanthi]MPY46701.1 hypothetical protein [Streptomyces phyllanthi]